ncbi:hypothetical protein [Nostoc sp.]
MAILILNLCTVMRSLKTPGKSRHKLDVRYLSYSDKAMSTTGYSAK